MQLIYAISLAIRLILIVFLTSACTQKLPGLVTAHNYSLEIKKEVLLTGFASIYEHYIEITSPSKITIEGLQGLRSIDPTITFESVEGELIMRVKNEIAGRLYTPKNNEISSWAELVVKIIALSRLKSKEMRGAKSDKIYEAVFDSILAGFDIHSRYAGASEARRNREKRDGFGGVGVRFSIIGGLPQLTKILPDMPAFKAGMKLGDKITHVGTKSLNGLKKSEVTDKFRGPVGTFLSLTVDREVEGKQLEFKIKRALITTKSVSYERNDGIVFLKINNFSQQTARHTEKQLKRVQTDLGKNLKGIILDLRGNSGGILEQSIKVANLFLMNGRISETRGRHPDSLQIYDASGQDMAYGRPIIVLVDGKSASAAEVIAAALQDQGRAIILGTSSFGKGTVQTVIRLPNDGEITLTWSHLITPSGYKLQGLGVFPVVCTSGIDGNNPDGYSVIKKALANKLRIKNLIKAWRKVSHLKEKKYPLLRSFCPPEQRKLKLESIVATTLLLDKALYYSTLNLTRTDLMFREYKK